MGHKQDHTDDARMCLFTGYWIVRSGQWYRTSDSLWSRDSKKAGKFWTRERAMDVAITLQKSIHTRRTYVEYVMSEEDYDLARMRDYLCYVGCSDDGHGGDITRGGLPILSYEEWMKA